MRRSFNRNAGRRRKPGRSRNKPEASAAPVRTELARPSIQQVEFHNASTPGATYNWDFGDGSLNSTTTLDPFLHTFTNTDYENNGIFTVTLTAVAGNCIATAQRVVEVYPAIDAVFWCRSTISGQIVAT